MRMSKTHWDNKYRIAEQPEPYGDDTTYRMGADFIGQLPVEDWGCGLGWFQKFARGPYVGVDGSHSRFCDVVAELTLYRSAPPAIFMRHVLEHNPSPAWETILDNAMLSFLWRFCLVIFTPMYSGAEDYIVRPGHPPDISLPHNRLMGMVGDEYRYGPLRWHSETVYTATQYGQETVFYVERP
jgi:hypothetical protein